jgi:hypothetical protein
MMSDVERLRKSGFKVRVKHYRLMNPCGIKPRGGKTVVEITTPEGESLVGMARCSRNENFNKRLGVRIALGRAFKNKGTQCISGVMDPP